MKNILISSLILISSSYADIIQSPNHPLPRTRKTFIDFRDDNITKQNLDYSCGASSLSTLLTFFYKFPKAEAEILKDMNLKDVMSSFSDLAKVSEKYGFQAKGILADYAALSKIKIPAIIYINHRGNDHFSVVKVIDKNRVFLADSSFGNRILTKKQFEKIWLTETTNNQKMGKVLLILPSNKMQQQMVDRNFQLAKQTKNLLIELPNQFIGF